MKKDKKKILLIDVDDTLYPKSSGCNKIVLRKIIEYMEKLGVKTDKGMTEYAYELYLQHGTTYKGLVHIGHEIDRKDFFEYVNDVKFEETNIRKNDRELKKLLSNLKEEYNLELCVFSNANDKHVMDTVEHLGVKDLFLDFFFMENLSTKGFCNKPQKEAYEMVYEMLNLKIGEGEFFFIDDTYKNLLTAHEDYGWNCILVDELGRYKDKKLDEKIPQYKNIYGLKDYFEKYYKK